MGKEFFEFFWTFLLNVLVANSTLDIRTHKARAAAAAAKGIGEGGDQSSLLAFVAASSPP